MSKDILTTPKGSIAVSQNHLEQEKIRAGWLGKIFGSNDHVSTYVAALVALILIFSGVAAAFVPDEQKGASTKEFWQYIGPLLGTVLGYLFGQKHDRP